MCGILAVLGASQVPPEARRLLSRRGPDANGEISVDLNQDTRALLAGFVLHMQDTVPQPLRDLETGNWLVFNGEVYSDFTGESYKSDTKRVLAVLSSCETQEDRARALDDSIGEGEWSLIFYSRKEKSILVGRDRFGRRSLVEGRDARTGQVGFISSVAFAADSISWSEVPVDCFQVIEAAAGGETRTIARGRDALPVQQKTLSSSWDTKQMFLKALELGVRRRITSHTLGPTRRFAVLFSGGIDSVLIAALAHRVCDDPSLTIPLVNVSFQGEAAPDRIAARQALRELVSIYPARHWDFIAVDVPLAEVRDDHELIKLHIIPKSTVMDFNLGSVLWFASKHAPSDCRALLTGLGADELTGGYGRHRTACQKGGEKALKAELQLDLSRMWTRNLGRDDRCIAAHGKELRAPFLDQDVVATVLCSPLSDLVDFSVGSSRSDGGDKLVIRRLMMDLGFHETAVREKRAAQFGSRMAKLVKSGRSGKDEFDVSILATEEDLVLQLKSSGKAEHGNSMLYQEEE